MTAPASRPARSRSHADEVFGRCFIDVFSCRPFDPDVAAGIVAEHFGGTPTVTVLQR